LAWKAPTPAAMKRKRTSMLREPGVGSLPGTDGLTSRSVTRKTGAPPSTGAADRVDGDLSVPAIAAKVATSQPR
jgi:hypothetical protein